MGNVVNVSGATELNMYLANNTAAYLAANMEPLKISATSDTKRIVHTEANRTLHTIPELPVELPYTNASLSGVTEVKGALDALVVACGSSTLTKWKFFESTFEGNDSLDLHYSATGEFPGTVIATWTV